MSTDSHMWELRDGRKYYYANFSDLIGKTLTKIEINKDIEDKDDEIIFHCDDGASYCSLHEQDCCESVDIEDICGDINDVLESPIVIAREVSSSDGDSDSIPKDKYDESFTWTFYMLATAKGYVSIRWYGTSNGYYSESVNFIKFVKE